MNKKHVWIIPCILAFLVVFPVLAACGKTNAPMPGNTGSGEEATTSTCGGFPENVPLYFSSYQELRDFLLKRDSHFQSGYEVFPGDKICAYMEKIRRQPNFMMIPYYGGKPAVLRMTEGFPAVSIFETGHLNRMWIWYFMKLNGETISAEISDLSEEEIELAKTASCSEFIKAIFPEAVNVDNYRSYENYESAYEQDSVIGGAATSTLVLQAKNGKTYTYFVSNGYLVHLSAPTGFITEEWLRNFSLGEYQG